MESFRAPALSMTERLDPGHYRPVLLENEAQIRRFGAHPLSECYRRSGIGHTAAVTPHYTSYADGVPFVSGGCIANGHLLLDGAERIKRSAHIGIMNGSRLGPGFVLLVRKGALGNSAVVPPGIEVNCSSEVMFLEMNPGVDSGFLSSYFNSNYGQKAFLRQERGMMITSISLYDVPELPVPRVDACVARYIGDKVRQAERLRERARSWTALSTLLVESIIDGSISETDIIASSARLRHAAVPAFAGARVNRAASERRHLAFRTSDLDPGRMDPWHHQPSFVEARASIAASGPCMLLGEMIDKARGIRGGATPLGAQYPDTGKIRFYRTADVHDLMIHRSSAGFLSFEQDSELARSRLATGDVLLTITGVHFGQSGVVSTLHLPGNISQHSVRFALCGHDSHYLVAYLSCHYGQQMIWREAYGATRPAIDYPGVAEILVRTPEPKVQSCIGDLVRSLESCTIAVDALVSAAKLLVEGLIEGVISEAALIAAQKALEGGDRSADREILKALRQSDAPYAKPLIADVEALYALLDEAEDAP